MKVKPKSNGFITINGSMGGIRLHVNQRWYADEHERHYDLSYKFLQISIGKELFDKMFEIVE